MKLSPTIAGLIAQCCHQEEIKISKIGKRYFVSAWCHHSKGYICGEAYTLRLALVFFAQKLFKE